MAKPWWQEVVTQAFNPPVEPGVDVGTPFHTPITDLVPGVVKSMGYGPWGGRIDIMQSGTGGGNIVEYYQHLDEIAPGLKVGSMVTAGQFLGLSGGQLQGGEHPNAPQYSTGPHVEIGIIDPSGTPVNPSAMVAGGPTVGTGSGGPAPGPQNIWEWFSALAGAASGNPIAVGQLGLGAASSGPQAVQQAVQGAQAGAGALASGFVGGIGTGVSQLGTGLYTAAQPYIIPLIVAAAIILIVLGNGQKQTQQSAPQIIPVPV